jgi:hypothetical protein
VLLRLRLCADLHGFSCARRFLLSGESIPKVIVAIIGNQRLGDGIDTIIDCVQNPRSSN